MIFQIIHIILFPSVPQKDRVITFHLDSHSLFSHVPPTERSLFLLQNFEQSDFSDNSYSYHLFPFVSQKYRVTTFQLDSHFNLYIVNVFPSQKLKINFCRNVCDSVCDHVCVVASKKRSWKISKGPVIALRLPSVSIVSYFLCISFVSGLESRGLSKLFIDNNKGL